MESFMTLVGYYTDGPTKLGDDPINWAELVDSLPKCRMGIVDMLDHVVQCKKMDSSSRNPRCRKPSIARLAKDSL